MTQPSGSSMRAEHGQPRRERHQAGDDGEVADRPNRHTAVDRQRDAAGATIGDRVDPPIAPEHAAVAADHRTLGHQRPTVKISDAMSLSCSTAVSGEKITQATTAPAIAVTAISV